MRMDPDTAESKVFIPSGRGGLNTPYGLAWDPRETYTSRAVIETSSQVFPFSNLRSGVRVRAAMRPERSGRAGI